MNIPMQWLNILATYVLDRILGCDTTLLRLPLNLWFDFENKKFGVFSYISAFVYKFSKSDIVPNDVFGMKVKSTV